MSTCKEKYNQKNSLEFRPDPFLSNIRLNKNEKSSIRQCFEAVFEKGKIYLFGSRVDSFKKGGDIDLYIQTPFTESILEKKLRFLMLLKRNIGEQKIDIVFDKHENRLIDKIAKRDGVLLCQKN